jgi:hypothetical protein
MRAEGAQPLLEAVAAKKGAIVREWLKRTLQTYPEHTSRFLLQEKDPFRNPVGHTLKEAFPALFDQLVGGMDTATITPVLDGIVRIRAVQDFTASQAVAFLFLLKKVVRKALEGESQRRPDGGGLAAVEGRIDEMALLAFDLFMKCRERIYEIKANEAKRRTYLLQRMHGMEPAATACGPEAPPRRDHEEVS